MSEHLTPNFSRDDVIHAFQAGLAFLLGRTSSGQCPSCAQLATKHDVDSATCKIMSAITDYADRVNTAFDNIGSSVDGLVTSVNGITGDVAGLKDLITKLQNSPGQITPEDQATLDATEAKANALVAKVQGVAASLKALDDATETAPTPAPEPATPPTA